MVVQFVATLLYICLMRSEHMLYVSRKEHFNAAHRLYNEKWTKKKNEEVFGPCANEHGHGHNFELIITVCGIPHADTGFVVDLKRLSEITRRLVIDKLDHKNLNKDVDFMRGKIASCENLLIAIWYILNPAIKDMRASGDLYALRLYETPQNYVEYYGPAGKL